MNQKSTHDVFVIDDDPVDLDMIQRAFQKAPTEINVSIFRNSEKALEELNLRKPSLILLDINMPGIGGKEMLQRIRAKNVYKTHPIIIMFTSSEYEKDIHDCYILGANSFVIKPFNLSELQNLVNSIVNFWFMSSVMPEESWESNK